MGNPFTCTAFPLERSGVPAVLTLIKRSARSTCLAIRSRFQFPRPLYLPPCSCMGLRLARHRRLTFGDLFLDCEEATGGL